VTAQEAIDRARQWGVPYVETSAKTRENVDKVSSNWPSKRMSPLRKDREFRLRPISVSVCCSHIFRWIQIILGNMSQNLSSQVVAKKNFIESGMGTKMGKVCCNHNSEQLTTCRVACSSQAEKRGEALLIKKNQG